MGSSLARECKVAAASFSTQWQVAILSTVYLPMTRHFSRANALQLWCPSDVAASDVGFFKVRVNKKSTSPVFSVGWCLTNRSMSALINRQGKLSQVSQPSVKRFGWHYKEKLVLSFCSSGGFSVAFPVYSIWAALSIKKWTLCETIKRGVVFRDNASFLFVWKVRHCVVPQLPTKAIL